MHLVNISKIVTYLHFYVQTAAETISKLFI